jgi:hypothetical protein
MIGNSNGNGNIEASTRLNHKGVLMESQNEYKHELFVTIRIGGIGGGGGGGGGRGGGGAGGGEGGRGVAGGGGKGRAGGAATGIIGGGVIGGSTADDGYNQEYSHTDTIRHNHLHFCVSILILCLSFWL